MNILKKTIIIVLMAFSGSSAASIESNKNAPYFIEFNNILYDPLDRLDLVIKLDNLVKNEEPKKLTRILDTGNSNKRMRANEVSIYYKNLNSAGKRKLMDDPESLELVENYGLSLEEELINKKHILCYRTFNAKNNEEDKNVTVHYINEKSEIAYSDTDKLFKTMTRKKCREKVIESEAKDWITSGGADLYYFIPKNRDSIDVFSKKHTDGKSTCDIKLKKSPRTNPFKKIKKEALTKKNIHVLVENRQIADYFINEIQKTERSYTKKKSLSILSRLWNFIF